MSVRDTLKEQYSLDEIEGVDVITFQGEKYGGLDTGFPPERSYVLDLQGAYVNVAGISDIVGRQGNAMNNGQRFAICGVNERVQRLLRLAKLSAVLDIYGSRDDAVKGVNEFKQRQS